MADRAAVLAALTEYANKPATSHDVRADPSDIFGRPPFATLNQFLTSLSSRGELNALLAEVAPLIRAADPFRGAVIAVNCGTLIEMGGDVALVAPHLLAELPRHLALAQRARERGDVAPGKLYDDDPDAAKASAGLRYLLLAAMTTICRKAEYRQTLRANKDVVAAITFLRDSSAEADFVAQVLGYADDLDLIVLAPKEMKGFHVRCEAVATCAHLFTLLQGALIGGGHLAGEPVDDDVMAVATGAVPATGVLSDHARFHFVTWHGSLDNGIDSLIGLPVEETPLCISALDGQRIVLVGPSQLGGRGWDSNFFANIHDALKSRAEVVEVLSPDQVQRWLDRIQQAKAKR